MFNVYSTSKLADTVCGGPTCRFDMMHVMVDEPDAAQDRVIAEHIVNVHREKMSIFERVPYGMPDMHRYNKYARSIKPQLTDEVTPCPCSKTLRSALELSA